jgi:hypothetical protein
MNFDDPGRMSIALFSGALGASLCEEIDGAINKPIILCVERHSIEIVVFDDGTIPLALRGHPLTQERLQESFKSVLP